MIDSPWRRVVPALLADAAFVAAWWLLVFYPGDTLLTAEATDPVTLDGQPSRALHRLPPDGSHALIEAGDAWHLIAWDQLAGSDLTPARAARGQLAGDIQAAIYRPETRDAVVLLEAPDESWRLHTWRLGEPPDPGAPTPRSEAPVWLDLSGGLHVASELALPRGATLDGWVYPAGPNLVVEMSNDEFAVVDPATGATLADQYDGDTLRPYPRAETAEVLYYTSASSYPRHLTCTTTSCDPSLASVDWPYDAYAVASSPGLTRLAACADDGLYLYELGDDYGLYAGKHDAPCADLHWLGEDELILHTGTALARYTLEPSPGRLFAGLWR